MEAHHHEEFKKMMSQHQEIEKMREERKRKRAGDRNDVKQLKLIGSNNSQLALKTKLDPQVQARWDEAAVKFLCETGSSFRSCEKLDILLSAIWPNGRFRLKVRSRQTLS